MNQPKSSRLFGGMPAWGVAVLAVAVFSLVAFFSLLAVVSVRAAGVRARAEATATDTPAQPLNPSLLAVPGSIHAGARLAVSGEGWPADDTIIIGLDLADTGSDPAVELGAVVAAGSTDADGSFTASFTFPTESRWSEQTAAMVVGRSTKQPDLVRWSRVAIIQPTPTSPPATAAPSPTAPAGSACTDRAEFVSDVTIPDRTIVQAGKSFDKIWRLRNSGTCTWTTGYALVFVDGSAMGAPSSINLFGNVAPGSTVDLKVTLTAPTTNGTYGANWMLRNSSGQRFGIGKDANGPFWVKIQVGPSSGAGGAISWKAEYFNNIELKGNPVLTRTDAVIDFDWKRGSPASGINADNFSVRWTGKAEFEAGTYRFKASADDGVRLWVDGVLVIDSWKDGSVRELTADVALTKGSHSIKLEYYERTHDAVIRLSWSKVSSPSFSDWKGEYFANRDLKGTPALVRNDRDVEFDWSKNAPAAGLPVDDFSVRWTRKMSFEAGIYRLRAISDDGVRVYVDGKLVINEWRDQGANTTYAVDLNLSGSKTLVVEYYEHSGNARIRFWIERQVPPTATPSPTVPAPTEVPPTEVPPTEVPPTEVPPTLVYSFAANLCSAAWSNGTEDLPCPGDTDSDKGSAIAVDDPTLENGSTPGVKSILAKPQQIIAGLVRGAYPAITVSSGDRFEAVIGCASSQPDCEVVFVLGYQIGSGPIETLGYWDQSFDGTVQSLSVSLASLHGQQVSFVLGMVGEQASSQNAAYWVNPRIVR